MTNPILHCQMSGLDVTEFWAAEMEIGSNDVVAHNVHIARNAEVRWGWSKRVRSVVDRGEA